MSARRLAVLALALLAGCSKTTARPGLRLLGPSAVAVFHGYTTRDAAALRAYLAVANERGDDLRILDAVDGKAVLAPALILSMSVPTQPRPVHLVSSPLHDRDGSGAEVKGPDLLAVAPDGEVTCDPALHPGRTGGCIQVVATWTTATAVVGALTIDVAALAAAAGAGDTQVLSMVAAPVPEADPAQPGAWRAASGRARLVAGVAGQRLLVADFARSTSGDGSIVLDGTPSLHDLGFEAVSLAASPDLAHLYAASPDPIGGVEGVAELAFPGGAGQAPTVRALPAGAPTTVVMAARVRLALAPPNPASTATPKPSSFGPEVLRVYASLEPTRCGLDHPVACGLAVLDPVLGGPAADPAGEQPGHAPIATDGFVQALAAIYPPTWGGGTIDGVVVSPPAASPPATVALQKLQVSIGPRWTSTLGAAATSLGRIMLLDLGVGAVANVSSMVTGSLATRVDSALSGVPAVNADGSPDPVEAGAPYPALWDDLATTPAKTRDTTLMKGLLQLTPGYTRTESWDLTWQGTLPHLDGVSAFLQAGAGGAEWLAVQEATGLPSPAEPFRGVARLYDPRLGLQAGDVVVVTPVDAACPGSFELAVTSLLAPDTARFPGGAVGLSGTLPACLVRGPQAVKATFRTSGFVLVGTESGYAGRPRVDESFALRWEDEGALSCPMLQGAAWPPPACDAGCRARCERLLLARKARRLTYVMDSCASLTDATQLAACEARWARLRRPGQSRLAANPVGPALAFRLGLVSESGGTPDPAVSIRRGALLRIAVQSGIIQESRRPASGTTTTGDVLPRGLATFDRSEVTALPADGVRVLAAFPGNLLLDFTPSNDSGTVTIHR